MPVAERLGEVDGLGLRGARGLQLDTEYLAAPCRGEHRGGGLGARPCRRDPRRGGPGLTQPGGRLRRRGGQPLQDLADLGLLPGHLRELGVERGDQPVELGQPGLLDPQPLQPGQLPPALPLPGGEDLANLTGIEGLIDLIGADERIGLGTVAAETGPERAVVSAERPVADPGAESAERVVSLGRGVVANPLGEGLTNLRGEGGQSGGEVGAGGGQVGGETVAVLGRPEAGGGALHRRLGGGNAGRVQARGGETFVQLPAETGKDLQAGVDLGLLGGQLGDLASGPLPLPDDSRQA